MFTKAKKERRLKIQAVTPQVTELPKDTLIPIWETSEVIGQSLSPKSLDATSTPPKSM